MAATATTREAKATRTHRWKLACDSTVSKLVPPSPDPASSSAKDDQMPYQFMAAMVAPTATTSPTTTVHRDARATRPVMPRGYRRHGATRWPNALRKLVPDIRTCHTECQCAAT